MTTPTLPEGGDGSIPIVVEKLRLVGYACFWGMVATGIFLTRAFSSVDLDQTLLREVFGYNNICVYFDYPPSTYVLPFLWAGTLVVLLAYLGAHWLHMRSELVQGTLSLGLYRTLTALKVAEALALVAFSTIFAVAPEGRDHTLMIHTVPFFLLQIGLVSLALSNTVHGIRGGYWRRLELPSWFHRGAIVYCVVFAVVVAVKIPMTANSLLGSPWWDQRESFELMAISFDRAFLVLGGLVPMWKSAYLLRTRSHLLENVRVSAGTWRLGSKALPLPTVPVEHRDPPVLEHR
jgi:hypothetical protein